MDVKIILSLLTLVVSPLVLGAEHRQAQARLEHLLCYGCEPPDAFPDGEPPDVPLRNRDALAEFSRFISWSGWTTNQFIEGLTLAFTNCTTVTSWTQEEQRVGFLSEDESVIGVKSVEVYDVYLLK